MSAAATDEVALLAEPIATLEIWAGRGHAVSRAEAAVIASPPFQRLRRLRQMGLAHHAWPNAENTRFSHSLGVACWAAAYLAALRRSDDAETRAALARLDAGLDGLSLDLVVRLCALLHDIDLLPLGHTLRYQSGLFDEAPGRPRLEACLDALRAHVRADGFRDAGAARAALIARFERHLDLAALALAGDDAARPPAARLAEALVNCGIGADLFDFALRDSVALGRRQALHADLPAGLRLGFVDGAPRLMLDAGRPDQAAAHVGMADDLYRARFEVFAGAIFHPVKLAADAMLDGAIRAIAARGGALPAEGDLLGLGDDALLDRLAAAEAAAARGARPLLPALQAGRLHREIYRMADLASFQQRPDAGRALALDPAWRDEAESALAACLPWAGPGDLIVAVAPPRMQAKPADALLRGADGAYFTLAEAAARGFATEAAATADRYAGLWSLRVYLAPDRPGFAAQAAQAAALCFGPAAAP